MHQNISTNWPAEDKHNFFNIMFDNCVSQLNEDTSPILEVLTSKVMRPPLLTYLHTYYKEIGIRINSTYGARKKLAHRKHKLLEEANVHAPSSQTSDPPVQSTTPSAVNESSFISASLSTTMCHVTQGEGTKRALTPTLVPCAASNGLLNVAYCGLSAQMWGLATYECDTTLRSRIKWMKVTAQGGHVQCVKKVNNFYKHHLMKGTIAHECIKWWLTANGNMFKTISFLSVSSKELMVMGLKWTQHYPS